MRSRLLGTVLCVPAFLLACQRADLPTTPDGTVASTSSGSPFSFATSDPGTYLSDPTAAASPSPGPTLLTPSAGNGAVLPNNFYRYVGRGFLQNWLNHPVAVATSHNDLLVGDASHLSDPFGPYGGVVEFDGRSSDATTPLGAVFTTLDQATPPDRLSPGMRAVAADARVLLAMTDQGVYGFMVDTRYPLNLGRPFTAAGQDLAIAGNTVYVAQDTAINAFRLDTFASDSATSAIPVTARGLGTDGAGSLFVATATQVIRYSQGQAGLTFDGKGADGKGPGFESPQDVAVDRRNGDIYALDRHAVLRFDASGHFIARFGQDLIQGGTSIAVDESGDVFVADSTAHQVLQFEPGR